MISQALKTYRKSLNELYYLRVYSGTGQARTPEDLPVHGKQVAGAGATATTIIGQISEEVRQVVLLAEDIPIPLNTNHRLIINGKEYAIVQFDPRTRDNVTLGFNVKIKG